MSVLDLLTCGAVLILGMFLGWAARDFLSWKTGQTAMVQELKALRAQVFQDRPKPARFDDEVKQVVEAFAGPHHTKPAHRTMFGQLNAKIESPTFPTVPSDSLK